MIKKHIPNAITCCNLVSGCVATVFALGGQVGMALLFIIIGAVFDFFDGMSARLLGVSSPIGKELDSLADDVTFGVAPATIAFFELGAYVMAAFAALRLAKFNLDERQAMGFIGLPTPANALFWGSLVVGMGDVLESSPYMVFVVLALIVASSVVMVSELPMFALKFKHWGWKGNELKYVFLITCLPLIAVFRLSAFAVIVAWYVILSIYANRKGTKK